MEKFRTNLMWGVSRERRESMRNFLESEGFELFKGQMWKYDKELAKKEEKNFPLAEDFDYYVTIPNKRRNDFDEVMIHLSHLRSYLLTFGGEVPSENFLNSFDNFEINEGNSEAYESATGFLDLEKNLKGLWLSGDVGNGKSHLLLSIASELLKRRATSDYAQLKEGEHNFCPIYQSEISFDKKDFPLVILKSYTNRYAWSSSNSRYAYKNLLGEDVGESLFLFDDVYEDDSEKILDLLTKMFNKQTGNIVVTSNVGIRDWLEIASHGRSPSGLEDRIKSFVKEVDIKGNSRRRVSW